MTAERTNKSAGKTRATKKSATKAAAAKGETSKGAAKVKRPTAPPSAAKRQKARAPATPSQGLSAAEHIARKIAELKDWRGELLKELRALIHEVDPEVVEDWKWMGTPVWSHDGMYANANALKDKVKLTFHHGAKLSDPHKLFNAGLEGNKWRAIDFFAGDKINRPALKALLRAAIHYNETHAVPKSKGSRDFSAKAPPRSRRTP